MESEFQYIGKSLPRQEGPAKLRGRAGYVDDFQRPGALHGRLVLSPYAHAKITRIDTAAARAVKGVVGVYTAKELPQVGLFAAEEVYWEGEPVAVVLATDLATAEDAAELVEVDYDPLPVVTNVLEAMKPGSPLARPLDKFQGHADAGAHGEGTSGGQKALEKPRNCTEVMRYYRGNPESALESADVVAEGEYVVDWVYQGFLETHGSLAEAGPDGDMTVWTSTQGQFGVRRRVASVLGLPETRVKVVGATVGGGFGGKWSLLEPLVAVLSREHNRPVSIILDRMQDLHLTNPSPATILKVKLGAKRDGTLVALDADVIFDAGASPGSPLGIAAFMMAGTYKIPHYDVRAYEILTNKTPNGAYRAPGAPQGYMGLEVTLNRLARKLGRDPLDLRLQNASREGDPRPDGDVWPRIGLVECLERAQEQAIWKERSQVGANEGVALAVGGWGGGLEPASAACQVNGDGTVVVRIGSIDLTGTTTTMANVAAEVLGIRPDMIRIIASDTEQSPYAGSTGGSKITYTVGAAVLDAAQAVRKQILDMAADQMEAAVEDLDIRDGVVVVKGVPGKGISVKDVARQTTRFGGKYAPLAAQGSSALTVAYPAFTVHVVKAKVDPDTGHVRLSDYLAVQDVGRALNPKEVQGQIMGGVMQGIGRALLERMAFDDQGVLVGSSFLDYLMPTMHDAPPIQVELVEVPAPIGPFGAKGVGEPPAVPGAAAITSAVEEAMRGAELPGVPITPDMVRSHLSVRA